MPHQLSSPIASFRNREPVVCVSTVGSPTSATWPESTTQTRSEPMMVEIRCAMHNTVWLANSEWMVCWIKASVSTSTAEVASSSRRMRFARNKARARHICCRWPAEKFPPFSATVDSSPLSSHVPLLFCEFEMTSMCADRCAHRKAFQSASSLHSTSGSKLNLTVPEKKYWILWNNCNATPHPVQTKCGDINAVNERTPSIQVHDA